MDRVALFTEGVRVLVSEVARACWLIGIGRDVVRVEWVFLVRHILH